MALAAGADDAVVSADVADWVLAPARMVRTTELAVFCGRLLESTLRASRFKPTVVIQVKVHPRAKVSSLEQLADGTWVARLKAPPVDGKANAELVKLVAEHFHCRTAEVSIKSGTSGRTKLIEVPTDGPGERTRRPG